MNQRYIHIKKSALQKGGVLTKEDITVCYLSSEELDWYLEAQVPGEDVLINTRGLRGLMEAV